MESLQGPLINKQVEFDLLSIERYALLAIIKLPTTPEAYRSEAGIRLRTVLKRLGEVVKELNELQR